MAAFGEGEIIYLTEVLGITHIVKPEASYTQRTPDRGEQPDITVPAQQPGEKPARQQLERAAEQVLIRGDLGASALVCLLSKEPHSLVANQAAGATLLNSQEVTLAEKMMFAMKLSPDDVIWLEWAFAGERAPPPIRDVAHSAGFRPLLCFGGDVAEALTGQSCQIGSWTDWDGLKLMTTYSLNTLLDQPDLKKVAWQHLQMVMKILD